MLCAVAQSAYVFGSEEEVQVQAASPEAQQGWGSYLYSTASSAAAAAKRKATQAAAAVKAAPGEWWGIMKRGTKKTTPFEQAKQTSTAGMAVGAVLGYIATKNQDIATAVMADAPFMAYLTKFFGGAQQGGLVLAGSVSFSIPVFVTAYGIQKILVYYHNKDIAARKAEDRLAAIEQVKTLISMQIASPLTYPTRSTKLHALLKKNEFLVDMKDVDGIVAQACSELSKQFTAIEYSDRQRAKDSLVDAELGSLRKRFVQKEITTIDGQIAEASKDVSDILTMLERPNVKAALSTVLRLQQQKLVEAKAPEAFASTSSASFYKPMTEKEKAGYAKRWAGWKVGMEEAGKKTMTWEKSKENMTDNQLKFYKAMMPQQQAEYVALLQEGNALYGQKIQHGRLYTPEGDYSYLPPETKFYTQAELDRFNEIKAKKKALEAEVTLAQPQ